MPGNPRLACCRVKAEQFCYCVSHPFAGPFLQILEGYLLQGIDGKALAEKVLQCFKDSIADVTTRVVRSLLLTKPKCVLR